MTHLKQVSELSSCRKVSLCVMPQEHSWALRPDTPRLRKNFWPWYGLVISLTSTYMAETSCTSSLTMSHYNQCSRSLSIQQSPKWLQRMRMALQKLFSGHPVQERLSNVHCRRPEPCLQAYNWGWPAWQQWSGALWEVQHEDGLSVSPKGLQEFKQVTADDQDMQQLNSAIHHRRPLHRKDCPAKLVPYCDSQSELVEDSGLVYRGECLVVPHSLRADMLKEIHRSHIGIGGCLRRARELLYWPRINPEVKDCVFQVQRVPVIPAKGMPRRTPATWNAQSSTV